jgi:hypothetical protein
MGAARTAGHLPPAFSAMSETQTACTIGREMMGFAFPTASFGTSLFLVSFTSHHTPFTHLWGRFSTAAGGGTCGE